MSDRTALADKIRERISDIKFDYSMGLLTIPEYNSQLAAEYNLLQDLYTEPIHTDFLPEDDEDREIYLEEDYL